MINGEKRRKEKGKGKEKKERKGTWQGHQFDSDSDSGHYYQTFMLSYHIMIFHLVIL